MDEKLTRNEQKVTSNVQKVTSNKQKVTRNEQKVQPCFTIRTCLCVNALYYSNVVGMGILDWSKVFLCD